MRNVLTPVFCTNASYRLGRAPRELAQLSQLSQNILYVRQGSGVINFAETDDPIRINNNNGAGPRSTFFIPQTVILGNLAFGVPVGQLRVGQPSDNRTPSTVGGDVVTTDAQYLGIFLLKLAVKLPE